MIVKEGKKSQLCELQLYRFTPNLDGVGKIMKQLKKN